MEPVKLISTVLFDLPELSDEQRIQGSILSELQIAGIKRQIVDLMNQKLLLHYIPSGTFDTAFIAYIQKEAEITGQITSLQYLLSLHEAAKEEALALLAAQTQQSNSKE